MSEGGTAVRRLGVAGLGVMGAGVAQAFAEHLEVVGYDPGDGAIERARERIDDAQRLRTMFARERAVDRDALWGRIRLADDVSVLADADFVIECGPERIELKTELFARLDAVVQPAAIFATNTSAVAVGRLAASTSRPERVLGMHFMNPVAMKSTVEVVRGLCTSQETLDAAAALLGVIGKEGVVVGDAPGFAINRVLMLTVNEAAFLLLEGTAGATEVDRLFRECLGHAMGPLELADLIGLDVVLDSLLVLQEQFGDPKFRPCPLLARLVHAGHHGRKTGEGFHTYGVTGNRTGPGATGRLTVDGRG